MPSAVPVAPPSRVGPRPVRTPSAIFSQATRHLLRELSQQQFWCWGADIRRPEGNLLIRYGLTKTTLGHPARERRSRYSGGLNDRRHISLWGSGLMYVDAAHGALYLDRFDTTPRYSEDWQAAARVLEAADLATLRTPCRWPDLSAACRLLVDTCTWIADYEHWVASECGVAYRAVTITQWAAVSIVDARSVVDTWRQLAQNVDAEMNGCLSSLPEGMQAPIHW